MNKENAHLYMPFVQALADGLTIEHSYDGKYWEKIPNNVDFLFAPDQYRIATEPPKPIETPVWVSKNGTPTMLALGCRVGDAWGDETVRLFREVIEE